MADPTSFAELKQSFFRLVKTGANWRLKNTDGASDGKIADPADIAGFAGTTPADLSLTAASVGTAQTLSPGDHVHAFPNMAANTALVNATASSAKPTALAYAVQSIMARIAGNIVNLVFTDDTALVKPTGGNLQSGKVTPNMLAPLICKRTLSCSGLTTGKVTMASTGVSADVTGNWAAVASNAQVVPEVGRYKVTCVFYGTSTSTVAIVALALKALAGSTTIGRACLGLRYSATNTHQILASGYELFYDITNTATQAISIENDLTGFAITSDAGSSSYVLIEKVSQ